MAEVQRPEHIHGAVCLWLDRTSDHKAGPKPWSARHGTTRDGVPILLVSALTECAAYRLIEGAVEGSHVRLGSQKGIVAGVPQLIRELHWGQISADSVSTRTWSVEFRTPTSFGNEERCTPLPVPLSVWRSLSNRWNTIRPRDVPPIDNAAKQALQIWVSDFDARNEVLQLHLRQDEDDLRSTQRGGPRRRRGPVTVSGVVGEFRYRGETNAASSDFTKLLRFAEFAGVGRYTAHGLGHVKVRWPQETR